jgi:hypothetical protein
MQRWIRSALAVVLFSAVAASQAGTDVGVSIEISQPGVFGRVDIGRFPQPQIVVQRPIVVLPPPRTVVVQQEPVYLWVPPGHQRNWRRHCADYGACGVPVYFVQDRWYQSNVNQGPGRDRGRDDWRDGRRDDRRDDRRGHDDDRDRRHGHGHGGGHD